MSAGVRLQKYLAMAGVGSRRRCEEFIVAGRVRVDGVVVSELGARVDPSRQRVEFDGRRVQPEPMQTYLADKPRGVLCTSADPEGRPTIVEWAVHAGANPRLRLYSVGRLDYDSEGLILLTNDGELAQRLAHPRHHIEKEYRAWTDRPVTREEIRAMLAGIEDDGERLRALAVLPEKTGARATCQIILGEGRRRHIRRMLEHFGLRVRRLRRIRIGGLTRRDLRGQALRALSAEEVAGLLASAKGATAGTPPPSGN